MAAHKHKTRSSPAVEQFFARLYPYQREIVGTALLLFAIITLLGLSSLTGGTVSDWWANLFAQLFGWWAIPAVLVLGIFGKLLIFGRLREEPLPLPLDMIIGIELLFIVGLALTHLLAIEPGEYAVRLARNSGGGGFVGWGLSNFLVELFGESLTIFFLVLVGLAALGVTFRLTMGDAAAWSEQAGEWARRHLDKYQGDEGAATAANKVETASTRTRNQKKTATVEKTMQPLAPPPMTAEAALAAMPKTRRPLPPLDLLAPPAKDPTQGANARYQAQIIEETLQGFGIPVEVVEINSGPAVTQFGLKLGTIERKLPDGTILDQRVRVNKVVALNNDLALALSAAPIRIEAPVPGRPLVGIEVPNVKKTMVSLRGVIDNKSFKKSRKPLRVALGKNVSGRPVFASLSEMPHMLIAGATGSGKSVCINAVISTLLITYTPEPLRFLLIDPKMVELTSYNGIPQLIAPVVTDFEQVVGALAWIQ